MRVTRRRTRKMSSLKKVTAIEWRCFEGSSRNSPLTIPAFETSHVEDDDDEDKDKEMEITYTKDDQGNGTVVLSEYD